jgi:hypothetical protein
MDAHSITRERLFVQTGPSTWIVTEVEARPVQARPAGFLQVLKWLLLGRL